MTNKYSYCIIRIELLDFDIIAEAMFAKACCKRGYRLNNAKMIAREHGNKSLEEKLALLGQQQYMGKEAE